LNPSDRGDYTSPSQIAKTLTQGWVNREGYCPSCGSKLSQYPANLPVADFYCPNCTLDFELKSQSRTFGNKINDGAYETMLKRLGSNNAPSFYLLNYNRFSLEINDFLVIPSHFFAKDIIQKRAPLRESARRHGWVGCNIGIQGMPESARVYYIRNRQIIERKSILESWRHTTFLRDATDLESKGWLVDIMSCVERLNKQEFRLAEAYAFEPYLASRHPGNHHIRAKIRQQLQILRDRGYLEFAGVGRYRLTRAITPV
jgi:type II restriction enzyme